MKKTFPCGHRGKGAFCHRCKQKEDRHREAAQARAAWRRKLDAAPVALGHLPKEVAERALQVVEQLERGTPHMELQGKRLSRMGQRHVVSVPIGQRYRLICKDRGGACVPVEVITHETYNNRLASGGWA